jgi:hypothetical protein
MRMTDQQAPYDDEVIDSDAEGPGRDSDRRSLVLVLAVALTIVIIILVLLMLRGCDSVLNSANRRSSTNQIVPVAGQPPVDGAVSVWVDTGSDLELVLSEAGINRTGVVDMGGGRFIVDVQPGTEVEAIRRLKDISAVYDAGRVYAEDAAK